MSRSSLKISVQWRPVESFRGPWSEAWETLSDPGVALDVVRTLEPMLGPMVARVEASGGARRARNGLRADWLIDDDGRPNAVIRRPVWDHGRRSAEWAKDRQLLDAWETCGSGEWMAFAATHLPLPVGLLTSAAAACATLAVDLARLPSAAGIKRDLSEASSGSGSGHRGISLPWAAELRRAYGGATEFLAAQATDAAVWAVSSAAGDPSGSAVGSTELASFAAHAAISVGYAERRGVDCRRGVAGLRAADTGRSASGFAAAALCGPGRSAGN